MLFQRFECLGSFQYFALGVKGFELCVAIRRSMVFIGLSCRPPHIGGEVERPLIPTVSIEVPFFRLNKFKVRDQ